MAQREQITGQHQQSHPIPNLDPKQGRTRIIVKKLFAAFLVALILLGGDLIFHAWAQTNTFCANNLACTVTGAYSFSQQITSTVATGTAPFSIASTTVVPNLNSQLHNGLTAPASAIVGINDTQTLTAKTLTSPAINTPTLDGTGAAHVATQVSAATNYGTALTSQTIIASMPVTGNVSVLLLPVQVTAGVGCSAATNSVTVNPLTWTAPGGTVENINPSSNMGFTGNGVVDQGASTFGSSGFTNNGIQAIVAKSGTAISYTTTSTLASTGCTTTPQYVIYAKAIF